jgi:galactose mutarotase-like enzyme
MSGPRPQLITLRSPLLAAEIDANGAQLHSLRDPAGRDYLWHGDPGIWAGRAPILFPIVGTLNGGKFKTGNREFALARHGFARGSAFTVVETTPASAVFRLRSSAATLAVYPFDFELDIRYEINGSTLSVQASVRNAGKESLPASLGFHPGFRWPLPGGEARAAHFIEFEKDEPAPIRRIDAHGLLSPHSQPTPISDRRLMLDDDLFRDDVVILDAFNSHRVVYGAGSGPRIEIGFPEAEYLGIWTKPGAPFVCIEPWQGVTDPAGFEGDIFGKPGIFIVPPGQSHSFGMTISLRT